MTRTQQTTSTFLRLRLSMPSYEPLSPLLLKDAFESSYSTTCRPNVSAVVMGNFVDLMFHCGDGKLSINVCAANVYANNDGSICT